MKKFLLWALALPGCSTAGFSLTPEQKQELVNKSMTNLFWSCFLQESSHRAMIKKPGLPDAARVEMRANTNDEGRVDSARLLSANFDKNLVESCLTEILVGVPVAERQTSDVPVKIEVNLAPGRVEYDLQGEESQHFHGTVTPKQK